MLGMSKPGRGTRSRLARAYTIEDLRAMARRRTPKSVFDYADGAADDESALTRCRDLFAEVEFSGNVLRDISRVDMSTTILGEPSALPLVFGPTGFTRMLHHEGEEAVAYEAARAGIPYTLSTMGTTPIETVAAISAAKPHWFQLYVWNDRQPGVELVERAERAGYGALVLTVDTAVGGARLRDNRNGLTIPPKLTPATLADMMIHPRWWMNVLTCPPLEFASLDRWEGSIGEMINKMFDPTMTWDDAAWLRSVWPGTMVIKGIQIAEDAQRCLDIGADAVLISNHGGRQLGRARPPLRVLPEVRQVVGDRAEVFIDGGVMSGADIAACVALGADAVWVGRAYLFGLMAGGHLGVRRAIEIMTEQLERTMQLLGVCRIDELEPKHVRLPEVVAGDALHR